MDRFIDLVLKAGVVMVIMLTIICQISDSIIYVNYMKYIAGTIIIIALVLGRGKALVEIYKTNHRFENQKREA